MSDKLDFSKLELLTEEELNEEKGKWTLDDWIAYYTKDGVMPLDEGINLLRETELKLMKEKYGSNHLERK